MSQTNPVTPGTGEASEGAVLQEMEGRLKRYPANRYPIQHATTQFHLGGQLLEFGRAAEAHACLAVAAELFADLPHQQARARNLLGAALRMDGRLHQAARTFEQAQAGFIEVGQLLEAAAAAFNLGLVQAQAGDAPAAETSLEDARRRFDDLGAEVQAAAAARELASTLLASGQAGRAIEVVKSAVSVSEQVGDRPGLGAAANTLGLALLAEDRTDEAVEALRSAVGAHPRGVRPDGYAMAKVNLALAYEAGGDAPRARLSALQGGGTPGADDAVRDQAMAVASRLGIGVGDLGSVLDDEPAEHWLPVLREEILRWADADPADREASVTGWIRDLLARPGRALDLTEAWLGAMLELPPAAMASLIRTTLETLDRFGAEDQKRFRIHTSRAMGRFNVPQWMRLKDLFSRTADELALEGPWG